MIDTNSSEFEAGIVGWYSVVNGIDPRECDGVPIPPTNINDALAAAIEAYEAAKPSGWLPIASAPRDGRNVLVLSVSGQAVVWWCEEDEWWMVNDNKSVDIWLRGHPPTHWKPLDFPTPPTKEEA